MVSNHDQSRSPRRPPCRRRRATPCWCPRCRPWDSSTASRCAKRCPRRPTAGLCCARLRVSRPRRDALGGRGSTPIGIGDRAGVGRQPPAPGDPRRRRGHPHPAVRRRHRGAGRRTERDGWPRRRQPQRDARPSHSAHPRPDVEGRRTPRRPSSMAAPVRSPARRRRCTPRRSGVCVLERTLKETPPRAGRRRSPPAAACPTPTARPVTAGPRRGREQVRLTVGELAIRCLAAASRSSAYWIHDRAVLQRVDRVLVGDRLVVEAAVLPNRGVIAAGGRLGVAIESPATSLRLIPAVSTAPSGSPPGGCRGRASRTRRRPRGRRRRAVAVRVRGCSGARLPGTLLPRGVPAMLARDRL